MTVHFQIEKMVDLSTAHIERSTAIALGDGELLAQCSALKSVLTYSAWGEYGWIIYCSEDQANAVRHEHPELANLIDLCIGQGVAYLKLDCDAPSVDGLSTFAW